MLFTVLHCALSKWLKTLLQLGIFRKTSITGQFRVDWLRSKYRGSEWGYSVDFLRVEGYKPGEPCFVIGYIVLFSKVLTECYCETIFCSRKYHKSFWHHSKAVRGARSKLLVFPDVESWNFYASWQSYPWTGFSYNVTFITCQLLLLNPLNTSTLFLILDPFRVQTVELMSQPKNHAKCPQNRFV